MFEPLTKKQKAILDYISGFIEKNGFSPSLDEIRIGIGLRAVSTVHEHIKKLKNKGYLRKEINQSRAIDVRISSITMDDVISIPELFYIKNNCLLNHKTLNYFKIDKNFSKFKDSEFYIINVLDDSITGINSGSKIILTKQFIDNRESVFSKPNGRIEIKKLKKEKFSYKIIGSRGNFEFIGYSEFKLTGSVIAILNPFVFEN